jgi:hypothetical protein
MAGMELEDVKNRFSAYERSGVGKTSRQDAL